jgi:hypothetical protein
MLHRKLVASTIRRSIVFEVVFAVAVVTAAPLAHRSIATEPPPSSGPAKSPVDGPIRLFNGKDLEGLYTFIQDTKYDDPRQVFTIRDGLLHISGDGFGGVITRDSFRDYHLVVEYRWGEKTYPPREQSARDSGILVHGSGPDGGHEGIWLASIESQIIEGGVGDFIVVRGEDADGAPLPVSLDAHATRDRDGEPTWLPGAKRQTFTSGRINWLHRTVDWDDVIGIRGPRDPDSPGREWTRLEVICDGDTITNIVNGVVVNQGFAAHPDQGRITLQTELAELDVRRWELWPLGSAIP